MFPPWAAFRPVVVEDFDIFAVADGEEERHGQRSEDGATEI